MWAKADSCQLRGKAGEEAAENVQSYFKNMGCEQENKERKTRIREKWTGRGRRVGGRIFFF